MTEAVVSGLTQALLGKGVAIRGVATVLQIVIGWMAALIPSDLVTWVLGRQLVVSDVMLAETMIEVSSIFSLILINILIIQWLEDKLSVSLSQNVLNIRI